MTTHSDPGEQEHGTRRKPRRPAPEAAGGQIDLLVDHIRDFADHNTFRAPSEGEKRKEKALTTQERTYKNALEYLRDHLRILYRSRREERNPDAFVTADDARAALRRSHYRLLEGDSMPWLGALFREKGWKHTGKWVPSIYDRNNGRQNRCWIWEGA